MFNKRHDRGTKRLSQRARALLVTPLLAISIGGGIAMANPADAAGRPDRERFLNAVIPCESGGNPRAVNSIGAGGLFQFMPSTWRSVGGKGLPQHASVDEQWKRARILFDQQGTSPWVASKHCWGPKLGL